MGENHISHYDLECYYLGMVTDDSALKPLEEHLLACAGCAERADATQDHIDAMRAALIRAGYDPTAGRRITKACRPSRPRLRLITATKEAVGNSQAIVHVREELRRVEEEIADLERRKSSSVVCRHGKR